MLQEISVGCAEGGSGAPQLFEHADTNDDSDWPTPSSQLDFDSGFSLVDEAWKAAASLGDGIPMGHALECTSQCT